MLYVCICPICACTIDYWKPSLIHRFRSNIFFHRMFPYSNHLNHDLKGSLDETNRDELIVKFRYNSSYAIFISFVIKLKGVKNQRWVGPPVFSYLSFDIPCVDWVLFFMQCASSRKCTWAQNYVNTERN